MGKVSEMLQNNCLPCCLHKKLDQHVFDGSSTGKYVKILHNFGSGLIFSTAAITNHPSRCDCCFQQCCGKVNM